MKFESRLFWRRLLGTLFAAGAVLLLWHARSLLYPFFLAFLIAYLFNPAVLSLQKKGFNRFWAILGVYLIFAAIILLGGIFLVPLFIGELSALAQVIPQVMEKSKESLLWINQFYLNTPIPEVARQEISNIFQVLQQEINHMLTSVIGAVMFLFEHALDILISPILAFYILYDWEQLFDHWLKRLPRSYHRPLLNLLKDIDIVLSGIIRGQLLVAFIVGALAACSLWLMGLPYALLFGLIAGILDLVPYFGAVLGSLPGVAIALLESPYKALQVALLFFLIQQLESCVICPRILGESTGMHPLSVIFFLLLGGELFGILGLLLALPVAAFGKVLLQHTVKALLKET